MTISRSHVGNGEVPLASPWFLCEGPKTWMPWYNSILPEGTSHLGINLVKVPNDRCQGSCTCWSYLNICFEESLWVGLRPCLQKAGLNKILWLLGPADNSAFSLKADYSPSWFGRRSWGNTGVWLARREETQEVFFIALFFIHRSVSQSDWEDQDCEWT